VQYIDPIPSKDPQMLCPSPCPRSTFAELRPAPPWRLSFWCRLRFFQSRISFLFSGYRLFLSLLTFAHYFSTPRYFHSLGAAWFMSTSTEALSDIHDLTFLPFLSGIPDNLHPAKVVPGPTSGYLRLASLVFSWLSQSLSSLTPF